MASQLELGTTKTYTNMIVEIQMEISQEKTQGQPQTRIKIIVFLSPFSEGEHRRKSQSSLTSKLANGKDKLVIIYCNYAIQDIQRECKPESKN